MKFSERQYVPYHVSNSHATVEWEVELDEIMFYFGKFFVKSDFVAF